MSRFFAQLQQQEEVPEQQVEEKPIEEVEDEGDKKKDKKKKKGKGEKTEEEIAAEQAKKKQEEEAKQRKLEEEKEKKRKKEEEEKEKKRLLEEAKKAKEGEDADGDEDEEKDEKGGKKKKDKKKPVSQAAKLAAERMQKKKEEEERIKRIEDERKRIEEEEERQRLEAERLKKEQEEAEAKRRADAKQILIDSGQYMTKAEKRRKQEQERRREQLMFTQQAWSHKLPSATPKEQKAKDEPAEASPEQKPERKQSRAEKKAEELAAKVMENSPKKKMSEKIEEPKAVTKPDSNPIEEDDGKEDWEKLIDLEEAKKAEALQDEKRNAEAQKPKAGKGKPKGHKKGAAEGDKNDAKHADTDITEDKSTEECPIAGNLIYHDPKKDVFNVESRFRCPIICILGHVDTGKTKILDKIRKTNVQTGEAGGITQQIGASFFPQYKLKEEITKLEKPYKKIDVEIPGLMIIDTPGHESFSNLRKRGESLCDFAILVVDVKHGLENQTIESLNMLKDKGTPFIVALNKMDIIKDWVSVADGSSLGSLKSQSGYTQDLYDQYFNRVQKDFAQHGILIQNYWENIDPRYNQSVVPTSAITGEGIPDLLGYITDYCQTSLEEKITPKEDFNCTVMEVKKIEGLGTTIDVVLVDGTIKEGDKFVLSGFEGPIHTTVRALLTPQPLKELRVKAE